MVGILATEKLILLVLDNLRYCWGHSYFEKYGCTSMRNMGVQEDIRRVINCPIRLGLLDFHHLKTKFHLNVMLHQTCTLLIRGIYLVIFSTSLI